MLQPKREGENREFSLTLLSVQMYKKKKIKRLCREIKALKQPKSDSKNKNYGGMCACPHQAFCSMWYLQNLQCTVALQ